MSDMIKSGFRGHTWNTPQPNTDLWLLFMQDGSEHHLSFTPFIMGHAETPKHMLLHVARMHAHTAQLVPEHIKLTLQGQPDVTFSWSSPQP